LVRKIKKAWIDKGLKQKALMALTGLTQKHLSLIENDGVDPAVSVLRKIALALGVSADQLLGIVELEEDMSNSHNESPTRAKGRPKAKTRASISGR
jgi:transcriptional regulator with XRE-family HTH domain